MVIQLNGKTVSSIEEIHALNNVEDVCLVPGKLVNLLTEDRGFNKNRNVIIRDELGIVFDGSLEVLAKTLRDQSA